MTSRSEIPLGELMAQKTGSVNPANFPDETFDLYSIPAFDVGTPDVVKGAEIGSSKQIVQPGDVLLSKIVPHIRRAWVVGEDRSRRLIGSGEWIVFRDRRIFPPFLRHLLRSDEFHSSFMGTVAGVGGSLLRARPSAVARLKLRLPELGEQRRIAAILDQAEALRNRRRQALAKLDSLSKSIFLELSHSSPLAMEWPAVKLSEIVEFKTGKLDSNAAVPAGKYPFFTCSRDESRIDSYAFDCEALLLAGNNAVGDFSVKHYKGKFNAYQRTYVITIREQRAEYSYLNVALEEQLLFLKQMSKGTGTRYLTLEILKNLTITLPPIDVQRGFSMNVKQIELRRAAFVSSTSAVNRLVIAIQQQAFRGEL